MGEGNLPIVHHALQYMMALKTFFRNLTFHVQRDKSFHMGKAQVENGMGEEVVF